MSFDVYIEERGCEHCGRKGDEAFSFNYTHNTNSIVEACFAALPDPPVGKSPDSGYQERSWGRLNGWSTDDALPLVRAAMEVAMSSEREKEFKAMEPDNGWGSLDGVRSCFRKLSDALAVHPGCVIRTWG